MRAFRLSALIAFSTAALEALAVAQTTPPPTDPNAPPPGYQAPPPGYQQQPPPGYQQQPPPGYQQQPPPGYQQQPPPGYYQQQPPPGYYQQPPTAYQPPPGAYAPPPPPPGQARLSRAPLPRARIAPGRQPATVSARASSSARILGGRVNPQFSINGEFRIDVLNPKNVPSGVDVTVVEVDFAVSPLFHVPFPNGEFVLGPKLGFFGAAGSTSRTEASSTATEQLPAGSSPGSTPASFFDVTRAHGPGRHAQLRRFAIPAGPARRRAADANTAIDGQHSASEKVLGFQAGALF